MIPMTIGAVQVLFWEVKIGVGEGVGVMVENVGEGSERIWMTEELIAGMAGDVFSG